MRALMAYLVFRDSMVARGGGNGSAPPHRRGRYHSHVTIAAERFQSAAIGLVLGPARALRDIGELARAQLENDLVHVPRVRLDREGAGVATQRPVPHPVPLVVIERDCGDVLLLDVLPDVELGPVQ